MPVSSWDFRKTTTEANSEEKLLGAGCNAIHATC